MPYDIKPDPLNLPPLPEILQKGGRSNWVKWSV